MVDVNNRDALEAWLRDLPTRARVTFAARAALRSLPAAMGVLDQKSASFDQNRFVLSCLRASLISGVAGTWPTPEMSDAVVAAARSAAAFRSALSADSAALSNAALYALSADSADSAASSAAALSARSAALSALSAARSADSAASSANHSAESAALSALSALSAAALSTNRSADSTALYTAALSAESADSAAHSADAAALSATPTDTAGTFARRLWPDQVTPGIFDASWKKFRETGPLSVWSFWIEWYQGFLDGKPLDWELQRRVALIPDADWEKGPEHIAKLIEKIRRDFDRPKLDAEQLTEQARRLAANSKSTEIVANSTADTIEQCVREFMREEKLNELPETLAPLHRLPPLLRAMAATAQDEGRLEKLEKQIAQLVGEVARLTTELEAAKRVNVAKLTKETAIKITVQIATAGFWGTVVAGFGHLTGIVDVGSLLERLGDIGSAPPVSQQLAPPTEPFTREV